MLRVMVIGCAATAAMAGDVVFSTNFEDGAPAEISGAGDMSQTMGYGDHGFGNWFWRNATFGPPEATVITLSDLPSHEAITIHFDLAVIDSWDGSGPPPGDDRFIVTINGEPVFDHTFNNQEMGVQTWPELPFVGPTDLGFTRIFPVYNDSGYALTIDTTHAGGTLTIGFQAGGVGWQGGVDESFAIDNVVVEIGSCVADVNGDGVLNILDFVAFQALWVAGEAGGDCTGDGGFDILDFVCFQGEFVAGCE